MKTQLEMFREIINGTAFEEFSQEISGTKHTFLNILNGCEGCWVSVEFDEKGNLLCIQALR